MSVVYKDFISIDFESSGVVPGVNAPTQIGLVHYQNFTPTNTLEITIKPKRHHKTNKLLRTYDVESLMLTNISWDDLEKGVHPNKTVQTVSSWVTSNNATYLPIVAYNASFDFAFWKDLLYLAGSYDFGIKKFSTPISPLLGPWLCSYQLTKKLYPKLESYKLSDVENFLGLKREGAEHTALSDALSSGNVYCSHCTHHNELLK